MSNYAAIAKMIPDKIRSERLMTNDDPIATAIPVSSNPAMQMLFAIWYEFVEPSSNGDLGCPACLKNILGNFRELRNELIALEKDYLILKTLT